MKTIGINDCRQVRTCWLDRFECCPWFRVLFKRCLQDVDLPDVKLRGVVDAVRLWFASSIQVQTQAAFQRAQPWPVPLSGAGTRLLQWFQRSWNQWNKSLYCHLECSMPQKYTQSFTRSNMFVPLRRLSVFLLSKFLFRMSWYASCTLSTNAANWTVQNCCSGSLVSLRLFRTLRVLIILQIPR